MGVGHFLAGVLTGVIGDRAYLRAKNATRCVGDACKRLPRRIVTIARPKIANPDLYFPRRGKKE